MPFIGVLLSNESHIARTKRDKSFRSRNVTKEEVAGCWDGSRGVFLGQGGQS